MVEESDNTTTEPTGTTPRHEHKLRRKWQFFVKEKEGRKKGQSSSQDWQKKLSCVGPPVGTVESFWSTICEVFENAADQSLFMFREGVEPMWEDPAFANGGEKWQALVLTQSAEWIISSLSPSKDTSSCFSLTSIVGCINAGFQGPDYNENSRQAFLLGCLLLIGSLFEPQDEVVCGLTMTFKGSWCRLEFWLSTDEPCVLSEVSDKFLDALAEFHNEVCPS